MRMKLLLLGICFMTAGLAQEMRFIEELRQNVSPDFSTFERYKHKRWYKQLERYKWIESNCLDEEGKLIPANTRVKNFMEDQAIRASRSVASNNSNWIPLGLTEWVNGNSGYNPGNGRINALSVDPNNPLIIYACAASGGVWKTIDGGQTWNTTTDQLPILGSSDVAIAPDNSNVVYLGTGDRDGLNTYGVGVYKSTDAGATWQQTGLFSMNATTEYIVNALEVDPNNSNVVFAATRSGLYKTSDAGLNWVRVRSGNVKEVKINPQNSNTVFAVSSNQFYRSHDGGANFEVISSGLSSSLGRIVMDVTPADSSYVYLLTAASSGEYDGVYRSTDGGSTFTKRHAYSTANLNILGYDSDGSGTGSQAFYDLAIAVSKTNKNEIYTGGINIWKSTDGGATLNAFTEWTFSEESTYTHADIHSLDFYGDNLYCGSDGGAFKNTHSDGLWHNISKGLNISQIYNFSNSADGSRISIGCQDNGTNVYKGGLWKHVKGADGMQTIIDPSNELNVYLSSQNGQFYKSTTGGDDNSGIFSPSDYSDAGSWTTPIDIAKSSPNKLFIGLRQVYRSDNSGNSWTKISNMSNTSKISCVKVAPSDPNYIYILKDGYVSYTHDGGNNWEELSNSSIYGIADISISKTDPKKVYFLRNSLSIDIFYTSDGGVTIVRNKYPKLKKVRGRCLITDNNSNDGIYLGSDFGVYYTNKDKDDWLFFSNNLPRTKVTDLAIVNNKLRIATYGRGVWESELSDEASFVESNRISKNNIELYPNPATEWVALKGEVENVEQAYIFNSSGVMVMEVKDASKKINIQSLVSGTYFLRLENADGKKIVKAFVKY